MTDTKYLEAIQRTLESKIPNQAVREIFHLRAEQLVELDALENKQITFKQDTAIFLNYTHERYIKVMNSSDYRELLQALADIKTSAENFRKAHSL